MASGRGRPQRGGPAPDLAPDAHPDKLAERLLADIDERMVSRNPARAIGDWLAEQPDVEEVTANDELLRPIVEQCLTGGPKTSLRQ